MHTATSLKAVPTIFDPRTQRRIAAPDLPDRSKITSWDTRVKALIVRAVEGGLLLRDEALERYSISLREFEIWRRLYTLYGEKGVLMKNACSFEGLPPFEELPSAANQSHLAAGTIVLRRTDRALEAGGHTHTLRKTEFKILELLVFRVGRVVSLEECMWHLHRCQHQAGEEEIVKVLVSHLRGILGRYPRHSHWIRTVRWRGYELIPR